MKGTSSGLLRMHGAVVEWCEGRNGWWRGVVVIVLVWMAVRQVADSDYAPIFEWIGLPVHEAGHVILGLFGWQFLASAGGTIFEVGAPLVVVLNFVRQRDVTGVSMGIVWLGTTFYAVARYMADTRVRRLEYVNVYGGDEGSHDWEYMFGQFGLIQWDTTIAAIVRVIGAGTLLLGIAFGVYTWWLMVRPWRGVESEKGMMVVESVERDVLDAEGLIVEDDGVLEIEDVAERD